MEEFLKDEWTTMMEQERDADIKIKRDLIEAPLSALNPSKVKCLYDTASVHDVVLLMQEYKFGSVVIINHQNKLVGIITERDILMKVVGKIKNKKRTNVKHIMTANPIALKGSDKLVFVMHNMYTGGFRHVPVVNDQDEVVGMISIKDVMSYILDAFAHEINNVTCLPYRGVSERESA